jgi:hypothetical protein
MATPPLILPAHPRPYRSARHRAALQSGNESVFRCDGITLSHRHAALVDACRGHPAVDDEPFRKCTRAGVWLSEANLLCRYAALRFGDTTIGMRLGARSERFELPTLRFEVSIFDFPELSSAFFAVPKYMISLDRRAINDHLNS